MPTRDALELPEIADDIRVAQALPGVLYGDPRFHARVRERVFARSWQLLGGSAGLARAGRVSPVTLLPGCLDEPLVLTRDGAGEHCLSNVCTHRASVVVGAEGELSSLRCPYHGRRFALDGRFLSAPHFEGAAGFPSAADDLPRLPLARWGPLRFTALDPAHAFDSWIAPLRARVPWLEDAPYVAAPARARDYELAASWALYCDNFLEGLHVPFVHPGLARAIDDDAYETELFELGSLQIGFARPGQPAFAPPPGTREHGRRVAAYWFWLFPNLMLNFYPWGLSVNVVVPTALDRTRVAYSAWVSDPSQLGAGAGGDLDEVEREDGEIVEKVQRGVRSRLYGRGRYSPSRETGVHHFHRLLVRSLA